MRKKFLIVDAQTNEILTSVKFGSTTKLVYDEPPELRVAVRLAYIGAHCYIGMPVLASVAFLILKSRELTFWIAVTGAVGMLLGDIGTHAEKNLKKLYPDNGNKRKYVPSVGPWLDPYGLARESTALPGKKTYYIVDPEKTAIVDVKRLGKWGQAYVERRRKRQQQT